MEALIDTFMMENKKLLVLSGNSEAHQKLVIILKDFPTLIEKYKDTTKVADSPNEILQVNYAVINEERGCDWSLSGVLGFVFCSFTPTNEQYLTSQEWIQKSITIPEGAVSLNPFKGSKKSKSEQAAALKLLCKSLDFTDKGVYGVQIIEEMKRIFMIYTEYTTEPDINLRFDLKSEKSGVKVYISGVPGSSFPALKSVSKIKTNAQAVVDLLTTTSRSGEYDDSFDSAELLETIDETTCIRRFRHKGVWPVSPREFIICSTQWTHEDGSTMLFSVSLPDSFSPLDKKSGFVRGYTKCSAAIIRNLPGGFCEVSTYCHIDLNGTFPMYILTPIAISNCVKQHKRFNEILTKKKK